MRLGLFTYLIIFFVIAPTETLLCYHLPLQNAYNEQFKFLRVVCAWTYLKILIKYTIEHIFFLAQTARREKKEISFLWISHFNISNFVQNLHCAIYRAIFGGSVSIEFGSKYAPGPESQTLFIPRHLWWLCIRYWAILYTEPPNCSMYALCTAGLPPFALSTQCQNSHFRSLLQYHCNWKQLKQFTKLNTTYTTDATHRTHHKTDASHLRSTSVTYVGVYPRPKASLLWGAQQSMRNEPTNLRPHILWLYKST